MRNSSVQNVLLIRILVVFFIMSSVLVSCTKDTIIQEENQPPISNTQQTDNLAIACQLKTYTGDVLIDSKERLLDFLQQGYTNIEGNLSLIGLVDIEDLSALSCIEKISETLSIKSTAIKNLDGINERLQLKKIKIIDNKSLSHYCSLFFLLNTYKDVVIEVSGNKVDYKNASSIIDACQQEKGMNDYVIFDPELNKQIEEGVKKHQIQYQHKSGSGAGIENSANGFLPLKYSQLNTQQIQQIRSINTFFEIRVNINVVRDDLGENHWDKDDEVLIKEVFVEANKVLNRYNIALKPVGFNFIDDGSLYDFTLNDLNSPFFVINTAINYPSSVNFSAINVFFVGKMRRGDDNLEIAAAGAAYIGGKFIFSEYDFDYQFRKKEILFILLHELGHCLFLPHVFVKNPFKDCQPCDDEIVDCLDAFCDTDNSQFKSNNFMSYNWYADHVFSYEQMVFSRNKLADDASLSQIIIPESIIENHIFTATIKGVDSFSCSATYQLDTTLTELDFLWSVSDNLEIISQDALEIKVKQIANGNGFIKFLSQDGNTVLAEKNIETIFPSPVLNPIEFSQGVSQYALSWKLPSESCFQDVSYDVYLDKRNNPTTKVASNLPATNHSITISDISADYNWRVEAKASDGTIANSAISSFRTLCEEKIYKGNKIFYTAEDLISFGAQGYTKIEGNLRLLLVDNLEDLSSLSCLQEVTGDVSIYGTSLSSLNGLDNLHKIGGAFEIIENNALPSLDGLQIRSLKTLKINDNPLLADLVGLDFLKQASFVLITNNSSLSSYCSIANLLSINPGVTFFMQNENLSFIDSLSLIKSCNGDATFYQCPTKVYAGTKMIYNKDEFVSFASQGYTKIDGSLRLFNIEQYDDLSLLKCLKEVAGDFLVYGSSFKTLKGIESLLTVGGDFELRFNPLLNDISAFNVTGFEGKLKIEKNETLVSLIGLDNLSDASAVQIIENPLLLDYCSLYPLALNKDEAIFQFKDNGFGAMDYFRLVRSCAIERKEACPYKAYSGDMVLSNQEDISAYKNYSHIKGSLKIIGQQNNKINDLSSLACLVKIDKNFFIQNTNELEDFQGFDNIANGSEIDTIDISGNKKLLNFNLIKSDYFRKTTTKNLIVNNNPDLEDIEYLSLLRVSDNIEIVNNDQLRSIRGLSGSHNLSSLNISQNDSLESLNGLFNLQSVASFKIHNNNALKSLNGMLLTSLSGNLLITNNDKLDDISALLNLKTIGSLSLQNNTSLSNICVLEPLVDANLLNATNYQVGGNANNIAIDKFYLCNATLSTFVGDLSFTSQDEINDFDGHAFIVGDVTIQERVSGNIISLEPLSTIKRITGELKIKDNDALVSLSAFQQIESLDKITIEDNAQLTSLPSLYNIDQLEDLKIFNNALLTDLDGINLEQIDNLWIEDNAALTDMSSLNQLSQLTSLSIINNDALTELPNLSDISALTYIKISDNDSLSSLSGISSLLSAKRMEISHNSALTSLDDLSITSIGSGGLAIISNNLLNDLTAINDLEAVGVLEIKNNISFTDACQLTPIVTSDLLDGDSFVFSGNGSSETSIAGIIALCVEEEEEECLENEYVGTLNIGTQAQLDALEHYTKISGSLNIVDNGTNRIVNLNALKCLKEVTGTLKLHNMNYLSSYEGLGNLEKARNILLRTDLGPSSFQGFNKLKEVGKLEILGHFRIDNLIGFDNLKSIDLLRMLYIDFDSFNGLKETTVDNLQIFYARSNTKNLWGFENVKISNLRIIINNHLENFCALKFSIDEGVLKEADYDVRFNRSNPSYNQIKEDCD